MTTRESRKD